MTTIPSSARLLICYDILLWRKRKNVRKSSRKQKNAEVVKFHVVRFSCRPNFFLNLNDKSLSVYYSSLFQCNWKNTVQNTLKNNDEYLWENISLHLHSIHQRTLAANQFRLNNWIIIKITAILTGIEGRLRYFCHDVVQHPEFSYAPFEQLPLLCYPYRRHICRVVHYLSPGMFFPI